MIFSAPPPPSRRFVGGVQLVACTKWFSTGRLRGMALTGTTNDRTELERRAISRTIRAEDAKRAKVILMLADGTSYSTIEATLWCYRDYINRWRRRFMTQGLDGLRSRHQGQKPTVLTPALEAR